MAPKRTAADLVAAAEAEIETLTIEQAMKQHADGEITLVDVRDIRELEREGRIPGAVHAPRGMIEFWVDPESPYHRDVFATDKKLVFHCAMGWRSALTAKTVQDMGFENVAHIGGGFSAWKEAGGPTEPLPEKKKS